MKECPHCGAVIDDILRYCPHCGIRIDHTIPVKSSARKRSAILIAMAVVIILSFAGLIIYRFFATTHLSIDRTALSFVKSGGVMKLPIDYDGYTWSVSHSPEWADVLPHGDTLYVEVSPNIHGETRDDSIVIRSGTFKASVPVTQNNKATFIEILNNNIDASPAGQAFQIDYLTDGASPQVILPEFCHVNSQSAGKIMLSIDPNNTGHARVAKNKLIEDDSKSSLAINQPSDTIATSSK